MWPHIGVLPGCDVSEVLFSNTIVRLRYTWSDNQSGEGGGGSVVLQNYGT